MKILLTGATGFVGSNLLPKLNNYEVKVIVRNISSDFPLYKQILFNDNLEIFKKNIIEFNPDIVIHLASHLTSSDDKKSIKNIIDSNILFTSYLLEALKNLDLKLFINTGTFAEYYHNDGILNPSYFYAASKIATRSIIKYFKNISNFTTINIIPYTIYGGKSKNKKVIDYLIDSTESNIPIDMTSGEQILDFIHIQDVTDFYLHCVQNISSLKDEKDYHLGTGIGTTIKELAQIIEVKSRKKVNIRWGSKKYRELDIMKAIAPIDELGLNWKPEVTIENGIKKILEENL